MENMILYVLFVKVCCESFERICRAFVKKKIQEHDCRTLTKVHFLLFKWLCISLIIVLEMSHTQMLEASQESPRLGLVLGLVLEVRVAIVELFTDCRNI